MTQRMTPEIGTVFSRIGIAVLRVLAWCVALFFLFAATGLSFDA